MLTFQRMDSVGSVGAFDVVYSLFGLVFLVLLVLFCVFLANLPGSIAKKRGNPSAQAITVLGWVGIFLTGGLVWLGALIWALAIPASGPKTRCPKCAEFILAMARVCKHCGARIHEEDEPPVEVAIEDEPTSRKPADRLDDEFWKDDVTPAPAKTLWRVRGLSDQGKRQVARVEAETEQDARRRASKVFIEVHSVDRI